MASANSFANTGLNTQQLLSIFLALAITASAAYFSVLLVKQRYQHNLESSLTALLNATEDGIQLWKNEESQIARTLASEEYIRDAAKALLAVRREQKPLLASRAQKKLRRMMKPHLSHYRGYFLIAPDNISLASSRDSNVGTPNLLTKFPDVLTQLWNGATILTPLQRSDVSLSTEVEKIPQPGDETLFVGSPVRDDDGKIIALLTLRIDPYKILFPLATKGRLGETGESYFFDKYGVLLSQSRFDDQLKHIGLLKPGQTSTAHLHLWDPQADLTKLNQEQLANIDLLKHGELNTGQTHLPETNGVHSKLDHHLSTDGHLHLTKMAASAIKGNSGVDISGYRDYRGVPVVGTWRWDPQLHMGLTIEQDVSEAYSLFYFVQLLIYGGSALASMILLALAWIFISSKQRLTQLQNRLQAIVETADYGIVVIDEHGMIESINPAMESMFGYKAEEMINNNVSMLMPEPNRSRHNEYLRHYLRTGESKIIGIGREVEAKHKSGSHFPIDLRISRLELASGLHFAGLIRDISERKNAEFNIHRAREEAVNANRAKSTFLATMSHEIRTPLNGIVGTIDMLAHTSLLPQQEDLVETAQDSAILLQSIIDDILDFSKIEAGRLELVPAPLHLEPLVEKLGENLQQIAKSRDVELLIYVDPELPQINGDSVRLRQILYNLAGNAIKFSSDLEDREGQVIISAALQSRRAGKVDICFQVKDNGIGMNLDVQKRLFRPFVQGEGETTRRFGGTGLGLVITQRIVEIMNGTIELESTEGAGSTFSVNVTLEECNELPPKQTSNLEGVKVALLTNEDVSQILSSYLQHAGADVVQEPTDNALEIWKSEDTDSDAHVVVIDSRDDRESSIALRENLRNQKDNIERRFLLFERGNRRFARPDESDGMTLDLNAMRRNALLNAIAILAGRESPKQQTPVRIESIPEVPLTISEAREQGRLVLLVDDNPTNIKVISQQLRMIGYLAETAEDGEKALEMWRNEDFSLVLTDCHMPEMDGYQLTETIRREEPPGTHIPIVATTADALKGTAQKCLDSGMNDYLTKPMKLNQLRETLWKWAPLASSENEAKTEKRSTLEDKEEKEIIDPTALGSILGIQDPEILSDYYNDFIHSNAPTVAQIQIALNQDDLTEVSRLAHKLKSSARTVGAYTLGDCCQSLEEAGNDGDAQGVSQQMELLATLFRDVEEWIEQSYETA
jgi:PAS domain S-box-containing protein